MNNTAGSAVKKIEFRRPRTIEIARLLETPGTRQCQNRRIPRRSLSRAAEIINASRIAELSHLQSHSCPSHQTLKKKRHILWWLAKHARPPSLVGKYPLISTLRTPPQEQIMG
ncbi:hypothetical protein IF2G_00685 [Cordyceps javanica]|nr:hypothetical protein IF2G_00685 [Cordyceps javanica]